MICHKNQWEIMFHFSFNSFFIVSHSNEANFWIRFYSHELQLLNRNENQNQNIKKKYLAEMNGTLDLAANA